MRIVTIRTAHEPLVHPVLHRHGELRPHRSVAPVTEVRLASGEQELGSRRFVNRVASVARDVRLRVRASMNIGARQIFAVAGQASLQHLSRLHFRKGPDGRLAAASLDMRLSGAVAAFASRALGRLPSDGNAAVVRVLIEVQPDVGMTRPANLTSHEPGCWASLDLTRLKCQCKQAGENKSADKCGHVPNIEDLSATKC